MPLVKCPRCELNYMDEGEKYCKVCRRELKGEQPREEFEMCTVCNEAPALPGKDVCLFCLKEMSGTLVSTDADDPVTAVDEATLSIDPVSTMDEIIPEIEESIPAREYDEMEGDLSLNMLGEEEEAADGEDEDEDDQ